MLKFKTFSSESLLYAGLFLYEKNIAFSMENKMDRWILVCLLKQASSEMHTQILLFFVFAAQYQKIKWNPWVGALLDDSLCLLLQKFHMAQSVIFISQKCILVIWNIQMKLKLILREKD